MEVQVNEAASAMQRELPYLAHFARVGPAAPGGTATALYIREEDAVLSAADFVTAMGERLPLRLFQYQADAGAAALVEELTAHWQLGGWGVLDLRGDPAPLLLKAMIAFDRRQSIELGTGEKIGPMPARARLVVFAERGLIEEEISYPRFYHIFGLLRLA